MKALKQIVAIMSIMAIFVLALPSCGGEDEDFCKVSVTTTQGGTATISKTEVMPGWEVTLTATPENGYRFVSWMVSGMEVSTENPYTIVITENTQFKAIFERENGAGDDQVGEILPDEGIAEEQIYTIEIKPEGAGEVLKTIYGNALNMVARPNEGYRFVNYTINGEVVSTEPVCTINITNYTEIVVNFEEESIVPPQPETMVAVDLGLSVKWAICNLGAETSYESGNYYAWGEIEPKENHDYWKNYLWSNGSETTITKYCTDSEYGIVDNKTTLELEDDAAHAALGGNWRMPTVEEFNELLRECVWYWVELNGVQGYKVISFKTEKSIFLPAVGIKSNNNISGIGTLSSYWTNTLSTRSYEAERLFISNGNEDELGVWPYYRWIGCPIRPVYAE